MPEVTVRQWTGVFGPPKLPREIVARLNKEINAAVRNPAVIEKLRYVHDLVEHASGDRP